MAIIDVLPLKAAQRDVITNGKLLEASKHRRLNFNGFIYIHYAAPPHSARTVIIASVYGKLVKHSYPIFANVYIVSRLVPMILAVKFADKL